ncbi:MAG: Rpn family recombination-promoting nuclease/putative transposase, partial [Oscillospiraceae bacterium]|nr:Rpn family recombination-promoting nuclease/putative transposase [Oscillospiraceae bacterium]
VNCVLDDGTQIDLEMQASRIQEDMDGSYQNLKGKSIYYLCDLHSSQSAKGLRRYDKLAHSYQVTFCSYTVFPNRPEFVTSFSLRHDEDNELLSDAICIIYVELSKLQEIIKKSVADMTDLEKWAVFFQYASEQQARETVNEVIASKEALQMAGELLMSISKDERERAVFRSRRMYQTDLASDLATAEDRGERRGMEKGIEIGERRGIEIGERRGAERGERNRSFEVARRMLRRNRPVDEIAEITDLSVEDVEGLKAEEHERE